MRRDDVQANTKATRNQRRSQEATEQVTGRMVLICLVAFFAVVTGVNAVMITAAVSTFGGVETEGTYQAGLAFARETRRRRRRTRCTGRSRRRSRPRQERRWSRWLPTTTADRPLAGLQASARLVHPTDKRADRVIALREDAPGQFQGRIQDRSAPLVGQWELVIDLSRDGTRLFRSKNRIFLR